MELHCARLWVAEACSPSPNPVWRGEQYQHDRIRIGYLSGDFRQHPVAEAMAEILERHDRSRFETIGLAICGDDGSALRARIVKAFDRFHELHTASDIEIAQRIKDMEIDILIEVAPHSKGRGSAFSRIGRLRSRSTVSVPGPAGRISSTM